MNKLKALYDVVKTMTAKEAFTGTLTVQVHNNEAQLFSLRNEFAKDLAAGKAKAKITTEYDYQGRTVNHQSSMEFNGPRPDSCRRHEFSRHFHEGHGHGGHDLKGKLSRLALALSVLSALEAQEQQDKSIVLTVNAADLPAEAKGLLREKIQQAVAWHQRGPGILVEFGAADEFDFVASLFVNKNYEVEKAVVTLVGTRKDGSGAPYDLTARAELSLAW